MRGFRYFVLQTSGLGLIGSSEKKEHAKSKFGRYSFHGFCWRHNTGHGFRFLMLNFLANNEGSKEPG